jgi:hypothetical protein
VAEGALPNRTGKEDIWSVALASSIEWVGVCLFTPFHCYTILHVNASQSNLCVCVCVCVSHAHIHNRYNCFLRIQQHQVIERKIQHIKVKAETILEETEEKKTVCLEIF